MQLFLKVYSNKEKVYKYRLPLKAIWHSIIYPSHFIACFTQKRTHKLLNIFCECGKGFYENKIYYQGSVMDTADNVLIRNGYSYSPEQFTLYAKMVKQDQRKINE